MRLIFCDPAVSENTQRSILKRPGFLLGLAICLLSVCAIVLSVGTLISAQQTPDKLLTAFREQHGQVLSRVGVPAGLITDLIAGQTLSSNLLADLPEDQRRAVSMVQEALPAMATAVRHAAEESRTKSQWGIGISGVLLLLGVALLARESRRAKMMETNSRTSGSSQ